MFDIQQIKADLESLTNKEIYEKYITSERAWYFEEYVRHTNYQNFIAYISKNLEIPLENILIAGSAKTGCSFAPDKKLKLFSEKSDIDLILVSPTHFNIFWEEYLKISTQSHLPNYQGIASNVFRKFVMIEPRTIKSNLVLTNWNKKVEALKKDLQLFFGIEHEINYRIYETWRAVEYYHINSIQKLKNELNYE
jgi:hypothetical protein